MSNSSSVSVCSGFNYLELIIWPMALTIFIFGLSALYLQQSHSEFFILKIFGGLTRSVKNVQSEISILQVPKSWFAHFYMFGVILQSIIFYTYLNVLFVRSGNNLLLSITKPIVLCLENILELVTNNCTSLSTQETRTTSPTTTILTSFIFLLHLSRRLYETWYIFIYSESSKMTLVVYFSSLIFYFSAMLSLISTSPKIYHEESFCHAINEGLLSTLWNEMYIHHFIGILVIIYGSIGQHRVHCTLGNLRKDKDMKVVSTNHFIPAGGLYQLVSTPHYWCEILIYFGFGIIFCFQNRCWNAIIAIVTSNQTVAGLLTHEWYTKTFPNYPKRKAIIPYIW